MVGSCRLGLCRIGSFTGQRCFPTGFSGGRLRNRAVDVAISTSDLEAILVTA